MSWWYWSILFALNGAPISLLLADRLVGVPAQLVIRFLGLPWLAALVAVLVYGGVAEKGLAALFAWGALGGLLGTVALDVVRLAGLRRGAFPIDMPMMFGAISFGLAPRLQRNVMMRLIEEVAALPADQRRAMLGPRLRAIARLSPAKRAAVVGAMRAGLERLPAERRAAMMETQVETLATLEPPARRTIMAAMDVSMLGGERPPYSQPRGLPKIPMAQFRRLAEKAFPDTLAEAGVGKTKVALAGYAWHVLNGVSFGSMFTLLLGDGNWWLAFGWGAVVWALMMIAMPFMMPIVRFPKWFPVVPFWAHIAMAAPIGAVAIAWVTGDQAHLSLLDQLP